MSWVLFKYSTRSSFLISIIFFAVMLFYMAIIIAMYDPENLQAMSKIIQLLPEELAQAMGYGLAVTDMTSFMASHYYGFLIILFPLIYCIIIGNRLVAKHIDRGSMAYILSTPHTRVKIVTTQAVYLVVSTTLLIALIGALGLVVSQVMFPGDLDISTYLSLNLGAILLLLAISATCFFFSCLFNDTKYSLLFGGGIPVVFFVISTLADVSGSYDWFKFLTLFTLFDPIEIISVGHVGLLNGLILAVIAITLYGSGIYIFNRKDLHL